MSVMPVSTGDSESDDEDYKVDMHEELGGLIDTVIKEVQEGHDVDHAYMQLLAVMSDYVVDTDGEPLAPGMLLPCPVPALARR
eukprot:SAG25_NODE_326_length_9730_cov_8.520195_9_plen_83_part_00